MQLTALLPIGGREANFVTRWDLRALVRALAATLVAFAIVWLVTAASDEGQLAVGARAGRTLPLAPLCSAVGAALALATARIRDETRALEALGRSPGETAAAAAIGGALPSLVVALAIAVMPRVDVAPFYPRATVGDTFELRDGAFESASLGVRVTLDGFTTRLEGDGDRDAPDERDHDAPLPRGARGAAAAATALAGLALSLVAARGTLRTSLETRSRRRRGRLFAGLEVALCGLATLIAFQAAAAGVSHAALAAVPSAILLVVVLFGYRRRHGHA
jgi:hypothetical protein